MQENNDLSQFGYQTRTQKVLLENKVLSKIIQNTSPITFGLYIDEDVFETLYRDTTKNIKEIKKELHKYDSNYCKRITILIEKMVYDHSNGEIEIGLSAGLPYYYNNCFWEFLPKELLFGLLSFIAEKSGVDSLVARNPGLIDKLYKQFCFSSFIPAVEEDINTVKINLKNGTYVVSPKYHGLRETDSLDMIKYQLPFYYDQKASAQLFFDFIDEVLPDKDSQKVLAEYIGYIFVKNLKLEKCLLIYGEGANGKSVFYDIVRALLGDENICSFTLGNLCNDTGYYRAQLSNKLVNYSSELGGRKCPPDTVKKLISTEPIDARSPYGEPFELKNYCKFIFNTNTLPKETEQTAAYFRRFIIVKFGITIPIEKRDPDLARKIIDTELSGIFNWVLEGLKRIIEQKKFTYSRAIEEELNSYQKESNSVALFMEDQNYKPSLEKKILLKSIYSFYCEFCKENHHHPVSKIEFSRRLERLSFRVNRRETNNATFVYCDNSYLDKETESLIEGTFNISKFK